VSIGLRLKDFLGRLEPFAEFSDEIQSAFDNVAIRRELTSSEVLFEQGCISDAVFLVESGQFELYHCMPSGKYVTVDLRGPGEFLGEAALWDYGGRRNSAQAITPVARVWMLPSCRLSVWPRLLTAFRSLSSECWSCIS
jgi:CRP-like cAMP-binding protein